jgi:hypothetical protein
MIIVLLKYYAGGFEVFKFIITFMFERMEQGQDLYKCVCVCCVCGVCVCVCVCVNTHSSDAMKVSRDRFRKYQMAVLVCGVI